MRTVLAWALIAATVAADSCQTKDKNRVKDNCNKDTNCSWCQHNGVKDGCFSISTIKSWPTGTYDCTNWPRDSDATFIQHISQQGLSYGTIEEFNFRRGIYEEMDKVISTHNA